MDCASEPASAMVDSSSSATSSPENEWNELWLHAPVSRPALLDKHPLADRLQWYPPPARTYSRRELLAGQVVDFGGVFFGLLGGIALIYRSSFMGDAAVRLFGFIVYSIGIVTMLGFSALCHQYAWDWRRARRYSSLDYMGISAMIAGSYTPPMLLAHCYLTLAFVWVLGVAGTVLDGWKVAQGHHEVTGLYRGVMIIRFLLMGWCVLVEIVPLRSCLPNQCINLIGVGGILYTLGIPIFLSNHEFHMPVWHLFVFSGSACMYAANFVYIAGL
mmetsp:Transcript_9969/g.26409  ORF Transcript_9969/g.26409 Transcript_9969/m.26409 type:complete len:273 (-) Transcript_9969:252-1070(-)